MKTANSRFHAGNNKQPWSQIFYSLAPELGPAMKRPGVHVPCPSPDHDSPDAFRLFPDYEMSGGGVCSSCGVFPTGWKVLEWLRGWSYQESAQAIKEQIKVEMGNPGIIKYPKVPEASTQDPEKVKRRLNATWRHAVALSDKRAELVSRYLTNRGLRAKYTGPDMRFHPALFYKNRENKGKHPAILSMVRAADGSPVTLHRTYLSSQGKKADIDSPKMLMPYVKGEALQGGAIRLFPGNRSGVLGIAEGLETALAVNQATNMPVWAATTANLLEVFKPPKGVNRLLIWADKDRSEAGERAANALAAKLKVQGIRTLICLPEVKISTDKKGVDWLDVLLKHGKAGFPII